MEAFFVPLRNNSIRVIRFGSGPEWLIALHGYGDRARMFAPLEADLGAYFSLLAIELPFHGETDWREESFSKKDLLDIIAYLEAREDMPQFSLMGFSFGARLVMGMIPDLAPKMRLAYLLAPDGIKTLGMAPAEWAPMWLKRLIQGLLKRPQALLRIVGFLRQIRLFPLHTYRFVHQQLTSNDRTRRAMGCWLAMDDFSVKAAQIRRVMLENALEIQVWGGFDDAVLDQKALKRFCSALPNAQLNLLYHKGHRIIDRELGAFMVAKL